MLAAVEDGQVNEERKSRDKEGQGGEEGGEEAAGYAGERGQGQKEKAATKIHQL